MTAVPNHLDRHFRAAASEAGLLDVAYDLADSPVGPLLVAASARGLCRISFDPEPERELDEYFEGRRRDFDLEVDLSPLPAFQRDVLEELVRVPYGNVDTYGGLAGRIGRPRAARAVGGALNRNPIPIVVPCHRIVGASGNLVGYAGGLERKRALLGLEGAILPG